EGKCLLVPAAVNERLDENVGFVGRFVLDELTSGLFCIGRTLTVESEPEPVFLKHGWHRGHTRGKSQQELGCRLVPAFGHPRARRTQEMAIRAGKRFIPSSRPCRRRDRLEV